MNVMINLKVVELLTIIPISLIKIIALKFNNDEIKHEGATHVETENLRIVFRIIE